MDLATFNAAFGAAKSIKELGKGLLEAKLDAEVKDRFREMLEKIGNFQEALYFLRVELLEVQNEKQSLNQKIVELEAKLDQKSKVQYIKPSYWIIDGDNKDGPFCQRCYDSDDKLIRLQDNEDGSWQCKNCTQDFFGPNYHPEELVDTMRSDDRF